MSQTPAQFSAVLPKELETFLAGDGQFVSVFKSGPAAQACAAASLLARGRNVVVVASGPAEAADILPFLRLFSDDDARKPLWESRWLVLDGPTPGRPNPAEWSRLWPALWGLKSGRGPKGVLVTLDALLAKWPAPDVLADVGLGVSKGEEIAPKALLDLAAEWGYARVNMVEAPGQIAQRGDVLDVFAPGYARPVRLEFFGDSIEEMRFFDPDTQRSQKSGPNLPDLNEILLLPVAPSFLTEASLSEALAKADKLKTIGELTDAGRLEIIAKAERRDGYLWPGMVLDAPVDLSAWLPGDAIFLLMHASGLRAKVDEREWAWGEALDAIHAGGEPRWPRPHVLWPAARARQLWLDNRRVEFEDLLIGRERKGVDLLERRYESFGELFWKPEEKRRPWAALIQFLKGRGARGGQDRTTDAPEEAGGSGGFQTVLVFRTDNSRKKFLHLAEQEGLVFRTAYQPREPGLYAVLGEGRGEIRGGHELAFLDLFILGEDVLQPEAAPHVRKPAGAFKGLDEYLSLREGDLLVHRDYGLSRFGGLHRVKIGDVANDYLLLFYQGDDKLYLPVDRLGLIQRYKGPEGNDPSLDRLGGALWQRVKEKAKRAIEKIAQDLVEMYAWRKVAKGYAYGPPPEIYREFEADFGFEETPDQAKAIEDVLDDMAKPAPMDRLVCGDVGFGKTEVALRAAFRAVLDGRQVAILCPTTVLAEQHYQNFTKRLENFPVTVGMLSRFVPKPKQKHVLEAAAKGKIDILIGTHRMLSGDVDMPNLGLLVLDEEQRFGVKHKEKLKALKKQIDALTLTATPIPRTLQLSLSGVRALSVIETPPLERKPVETALIEKDPAMLRNIVARELDRGGQVFWLHNRVKDLDAEAAFVREIAPDARIGVAHGQMHEKALEEAMHKFWHGELDILLCTAIIESGLDFPRANTLIVDNAHMFGLGQLYQIRGRVGRSDRQAYAYFVTPRLRELPELAKKRLQVVLDMDYLGAGFQVAMEDLRLRGAGNILGEAQSGHIARVGLDLFLEMLEEEVRRVKGEPMVQDSEPEIAFLFEANLPESWMPDPRERLRSYKALATARTEAEMTDVVVELRDRFGHPPEAAVNFFAAIGLKRQLAGLQVRKADLAASRVVLSWGDGAGVISPETLIAWATARPFARLLPPGKLEVRAPEGLPPDQAMKWIGNELSALVETPA